MISEAVRNESALLPKERIASLDFQRGLAIWFMTFIHAVANVYNSEAIEEDPSKFFDFPIPVILLFSFIGIFAVWHSYFLLISTTVNSFAMTRKITNGDKPEAILFRQIITGCGLLLVNIIDNSFLYSGYFGTAIRTNDWSNTYPLWDGFFEMGTLKIIAWSIIISSTLLYFLLKNEGYKKYLRNVLILSGLIVIIIIASPFVHFGVDSIPWELKSPLPPGVNLGSDPHWPGLDFQALTTTPFLAWILTPFAGDIEPIFPYLATALIGVIIGLTLVQPKPFKRFVLVGGLSGVAIIGFGLIAAALGQISLGNLRPPLGNYLLMLGAQICTIFLFLWLVEFRGKATRFGNSRFVKHFRRWGIISLTIYTLQIFELLPRFIVQGFYNLIFVNNINLLAGSTFNFGEEYKAFIFALIAILFFEALVFLWSRINFILSFEWIITNFTNLILKQPTYRLNVKIMMNEIKWKNFKSDIVETNLADEQPKPT